jgi:D-lactate dehydrogenase (cytochrome)
MPTTSLRSYTSGSFAPVRVPRGIAAHVARRCYATEIEPEKPKPLRQGNEMKLGRSFQGQVMGSIGARLRREREQREQYERWRNMTDPSKNWMITFCEHRRPGAALVYEGIRLIG